MGLKEFSKELSDLVGRALQEGVQAGQMNIVSLIGSLETQKLDVHRWAVEIAVAQQIAKAQEQNRIITPNGATPPNLRG